MKFDELLINGKRAWDIQVKNPEPYSRVLAGYSLALGKSYMDGWWECESLDQFFDRILRARLDREIRKDKNLLLPFIKAKVINAQSRQAGCLVVQHETTPQFFRFGDTRIHSSDGCIREIMGRGKFL